MWSLSLIQLGDQMVLGMSGGADLVLHFVVPLQELEGTGPLHHCREGLGTLL